VVALTFVLTVLGGLLSFTAVALVARQSLRAQRHDRDKSRALQDLREWHKQANADYDSGIGHLTSEGIQNQYRERHRKALDYYPAESAAEPSYAEESHHPGKTISTPRSVKG
jgi:hypothetical protein